MRATSPRAWPASAGAPSSIRFSRPVRRSSSEACWPASEIDSRTARGSRDDVVAGDERAAGGGGEQRGEDAHGGRLAGAVVAEQAEHRARRDGQVQPAQRLGVAEAPAQVLGEDRSRSRTVVRHSTAYDRGTLYEMSREPKPPIWARPEPRGRGPRAPLSRAQIVQTALTIADEEGPRGGLDAADRAASCGAGAMSLYHYFDTRDELLDLMGDTVAARDARAASCPRDWREALTAIAQPQPRDVPRTTRGCCRRCRSARA